MKFTARFLLLLFLPLSPGFAPGESQASVPHQGAEVPDLPVIWDELRGLNELVLSLKAEEVDRRQALRRMESRLRDREAEAEQQRRSLDGLEETVAQQRERTDADRKHLLQLEEQSRARVVKLSAEVSLLQSTLNVNERSVEELKKKNSALAAELPFLQTRLRASESTVEQLRRKNAVLAARLCNTETVMEDLRMQISAFPASNSSSQSEESELETRLNIVLKQLNTNREALHSRLDSLEGKLNSSAVALGHTGPFSLETRPKDAEKHNDVLKAEVSDLSSRLGVAERHLEELQAQSAGQTSELLTLERKLNWTQSQQRSTNTELLTRLTVSETHVEAVQRDNADRSAQLSLMESRLSDGNTTALELRLRVSENHLEDLQRVNTDLLNRLRVCETRLEDVRTEATGQYLHLSVMESRLEGVSTNATELMSKLRVNEKHVEELRRENTGQSFTLKDLQRKLNTTDHLLNSMNTVQFGLVSLMESSLLGNVSALQLRLGSTQTHVEQLETRSAGCEAELSAVGLRLNSTEEKLRTQNTATVAELEAVSERLAMTRREAEELQVRVTDGEAAVNELRLESRAQWLLLTEVNSTLETTAIELTELENRLSLSETQLERVITGSTALSVGLDETKARLQLITNSKTDELQVAFSAGLTDSGSVGPFDEERTLIFSKSITNVGQAYDMATGVFTAPVGGVYFFSFTAADYLKGYMGLYLYRNNQPLVFSLDLNDHGGYASTSNAVALQLQQGDEVRLSLPASYRLYDDSRNFSVFSGFLLFPL